MVKRKIRIGTVMIFIGIALLIFPILGIGSGANGDGGFKKLDCDITVKNPLEIRIPPIVGFVIKSGDVQIESASCQTEEVGSCGLFSGLSDLFTFSLTDKVVVKFRADGKS